jgi:nitrous oxide reductase
MSSNETQPIAARRGFLRALGLSGAAAAAAVVPAGAQAQGAAKETKAEREKARYQPNSADVQAFYRTNRY